VIHSAGTGLFSRHCILLQPLLESGRFMVLVDCCVGAVYAPAVDSCLCKCCLFVCLFRRHIHLADTFDENISDRKYRMPVSD
jgi:hypothetical protein